MNKNIKTWQDRAAALGHDIAARRFTLNDYKSTFMGDEITDLRAYIAELEARTPAAPVVAEGLDQAKYQNLLWRDGHEARVAAHPVAGSPAEAALMPASEAQAVTWGQAVLLAGIQALCISADQEWCRQEGKLSEFDKGWFTGQLHIFDLYTGVEKSAIAEARAYIEKLSATAAPVPASEAAKQVLHQEHVMPPMRGTGSQRSANSGGTGE